MITLNFNCTTNFQLSRNIKPCIKKPSLKLKVNKVNLNKKTKQSSN